MSRFAAAMGRVLAALALSLYAGALCFYVGHRLGASRAAINDRRVAAGPEVTSGQPARWARDGSAGGAPQSSVPGTQGMPKGAFAIDASKPMRITWPLDIGPDTHPDRPDDHACLRARQGANELQTPGTGKALYAFRVEKAGEYKTWFRVRWVDDGIGSIECNNSWFAGFDDAALAVIGNKGGRKGWFWQQGPNVRFAQGGHWLRVELREDGTLMDRVAIAPLELPDDLALLDKTAAFDFRGFGRERPPFEPHRPVQAAECWAVPTGSLAIGKGHANDILVCASYQATDRKTFNGSIDITCPTAPDLVVHGERRVTCGSNRPFARHLLKLQFPKQAPRRVHRVVVAIRDKGGRTLFCDEVRFVKGYAWAFLGPFVDTSAGPKRLYRHTGSLDKLRLPNDSDPMQFALMKGVDELGLAKLPLCTKDAKPEWRVVADGTCYDWTGAVDIRAVYGATGPAFAYAVTWINAETALNHRSFIFQADDSGWLWVHGHRLVHLPVDLPREANRLWTSASLRRGPNPVVVKLAQNQRYWGFRFDVVDWHWQGRRGDVITGLEPEAWPRK